MEPSTRHKDDLGTTDELEEIYTQLFSATAKLHLLTDLDSRLMDQTRLLLDAVLANVTEIMAREDQEKEQDTKISWWEEDHWIFR